MIGSSLRPALGLVALAGLAAAAGPALAFDCAKAKAPVEKALCADPVAKASDEAMESAFEATRAGLEGEQRKGALDDQRAWLKERTDGCMAETKPAACLTQRNEARVAVLTARPGSGPGLDRRPQPFFVRQAGSRTKVAIALQLYRFADPQTPGERALNGQADKVVSGVDRTKTESDERDWSQDESWAIAYASPAFLSIKRTSYQYSGGAHGLGGTGGLNIDMKSGRVLTFADLFDKAGAAALSRACVEQVRAEKKQRGAEGGEDIFDVPKGVAEVLGNLSNWTFKEREATVHLGPYAVGSYAEGDYDCTLPIAEVNKVAKRALPLQ